jgi:prepilin-type N-terminal cleavage/methylation domain-containing protein
MKALFNNTMIRSRGFSLIEVLVSLSIFTVVMTISIGALMVVINANTMAQNTQAVMTNIQYALDGVTREIRTGTDYYCGSVASLPVSGNTVSNCPAGGTALSFNEGGQSLTEGTPNNSRRIALRLSGGELQRRLGNGDGDSDTNEEEDWEPLTSPNVQIDTLKLFVTGTEKEEGEAPTVTLYIKGNAGAEDGTESEFNIQTTIVQQLFDI